MIRYKVPAIAITNARITNMNFSTEVGWKSMSWNPTIAAIRSKA